MMEHDMKETPILPILQKLSFGSKMSQKSFFIFFVFAFFVITFTIFNTTHFHNLQFYKGSAALQSKEATNDVHVTSEYKTSNLTEVGNSSRPNGKRWKGDCEKFSQMVNKNDSRLKFVFFFGFNRCGSTATGMILDAHPNALIANEYDLFGELEDGRGVTKVIDGICTRSQRSGEKLERQPNSPKGYSFKMGEGHGSFQGNLTVVGIRKSYQTLHRFEKHSSKFVENYARLAKRFSAMLGVMVTRNVYDMIATKLSIDFDGVVLRATLDDGKIVYVNERNFSSIGYNGMFYKFCHFGLSNGTVKIVLDDKIYQVLDFFRRVATSSRELVQRLKLHHKIVKLDEMIANPRPVVLELCAFFGLECFPDYVDQVIAGLFTEPNPTRRGIDWTPDLIEAVEKLKIDFPDYLFGSHLVS